MPTEIVQLRGLEGPNLYMPQPGVFLQVRSTTQRARRLKDALKDGAQSIGMVLGHLEVDTFVDEHGNVTNVNFTTPTPPIGVALAQYVVEGLNRQEAGDEEWDAEGPLWDLQKRRRAEALPLPALQLIAEAASRGIPSQVRPDGQIQLGYGVRSWAFDPGQFAKRTTASFGDDDIGIGSPPFARAQAALDVPWDQLGPIPVLGIAGGAARDIAAQILAAELEALGRPTSVALAADYNATRTLLASPSATIAVVGLTAVGIAERGLALERCAYSAITDLPTELPAGIADRAELARVLGVPMLITDASGGVALNADVPEIVALAEYAPCPLSYFSTGDDNPIIGFHRAEGGRALFVREGVVFAAQGAGEQAVVAATLPPAEMPGALAALALLWAMGLTWEQIRGAAA